MYTINKMIITSATAPITIPAIAPFERAASKFAYIDCYLHVIKSQYKYITYYGGNQPKKKKNIKESKPFPICFP